MSESSDCINSDLAVIGAGPVGLFTVFQAGMLGFSCVVIDALESVGGQCAALYPQKPIYDIPAFPHIAAEELVERLVRQAEPFNPIYRLGVQAQTLTQLPAEETESQGENGRLFDIGLADGSRVRAKAVIVAAGGGAFVPNRPPLQNLSHFEGRSVFYSVADKALMQGKHIVIAGGGDSAVDWAVELASLAASVTVVHRRDKFRCAPDSERKLRELAACGALQLCVPYQLADLVGLDNGTLQEVRVKSVSGAEEKALNADILLPFYGLAFDPGPLKDWGLSFSAKQIDVEVATMCAGRPGVFAVGDIAMYPGKLKFILTGFAEAALAAHSARAWLNPGKKFGFAYSTSSGVPGLS